MTNRTTPFLVDPPEVHPMPERRRERPYYHRHEHRQQATVLDWVGAIALVSVIAVAIEWAGAWPA